MGAWFYEHQGGRVGPVSQDELRGLAAAGRIGGETLVWTEGFREGWKRFDACDLASVPPRLPPDLRRPAYRQSLFCGGLMLLGLLLFVPLLLAIPLIVWTGPVYAGRVRYTFSTAGKTIISVLVIGLVIALVAPSR